MDKSQQAILKAYYDQFSDIWVRNAVFGTFIGWILSALVLPIVIIQSLLKLGRKAFTGTIYGFISVIKQAEKTFIKESVMRVEYEVTARSKRSAPVSSMAQHAT